MDEEAKTGRRVILADGTTYEGAECGLAGGFLWIYIHEDLNLQDVATVFFNPGKTARILFEYGEMASSYDDMTQVTHLMKQSDGEIAICLTKAAA